MVGETRYGCEVIEKIKEGFDSGCKLGGGYNDCDERESKMRKKRRE